MPNKSSKIKIAGEEYEVIDAKESMTVPDCWVLKNKIGGGHGEAKFYLGYKTDNFTLKFFDDFNRRCLFLKSDLMEYLENAKSEYKNPQQPYNKKNDLPGDWDKYLKKVKELSEEILWFKMEYQEHLKGARVYVNSKDEAFKIVRQISLPKVTYISALKLKAKNGEIVYYFRLFLDYFGEKEHPFIIKEEEEEIKQDTHLKDEEKEQIVRARKGQGEYRRKLIAECPFCPITLVTDDRLLIASHIKPWVKSDNREKTDPKNGFMFTPTYDFLFDRGFISFEDNGTIVISPWLSKMTLSKLNLAPGKRYPLLQVKNREKYLEYHRKNIFKK